MTPYDLLRTDEYRRSSMNRLRLGYEPTFVVFLVKLTRGRFHCATERLLDAVSCKHREREPRSAIELGVVGGDSATLATSEQIRMLTVRTPSFTLIKCYPNVRLALLHNSSFTSGSARSEI